MLDATTQAPLRSTHYLTSKQYTEMFLVQKDICSRNHRRASANGQCNSVTTMEFSSRFRSLQASREDVDVIRESIKITIEHIRKDARITSLFTAITDFKINQLTVHNKSREATVTGEDFVCDVLLENVWMPGQSRQDPFEEIWTFADSWKGFEQHDYSTFCSTQPVRGKGTVLDAQQAGKVMPKPPSLGVTGPPSDFDTDPGAQQSNEDIDPTPRQGTIGKEFECKVCGNFFTRSWNLREHMSIHNSTREKPYICAQAGCAKKFIRRADLLRHENTHRKTVRFECKSCLRTFNRKDVLKR
jgi:hypothetical protein